jgi:peptide/nickel transport system substrate-binding protein
MDMNDVLYGIYFLYQWGADQTNNTKTFDPEYSPKANQATKTLIGIRVIDNNTIEVYQNFWHFDSDEIAESAQVWPVMPWEIIYSMEKAVIDGKLAFSRSDAVNKNVDWMSLIIPRNADVIKINLEDFAQEKSIPPALLSINDSNYFDSRYTASASWIKEHDHAVISNGPYYLDKYSPEARKITLNAFADVTYPFKAGYWKKFEDVSIPKIYKIKVPTAVTLGTVLNIPLLMTPNSTVYYYFTNSQGNIVESGKQMSYNGSLTISLGPDKTRNLSLGSNDLQIFLVSDIAYKPDMYHTSFLVTKGQNTLVENFTKNSEPLITNYSYLIEIMVPSVIIIILLFLLIRGRIKKTVK